MKLTSNNDILMTYIFNDCTSVLTCIVEVQMRNIKTDHPQHSEREMS